MDKQEYDAKVAFLRRYRQAVRRQRLLEEELAGRRAEAERITPLLSRPGGGGEGSGGKLATPADKLPKAVERILAAEEELAAQLARCEEVRREVLAAIRTQPDERLQEILYRRYILVHPFRRIAAALHLEERWVYRMHRKGLERLNFDQ